MKTFPMGGVHPSENKLSCAKPIEVLPLPEVVTIPLAQHIGAPAVAKVAKGDKVLTGQLIAEAGSFMSANIHSPVSGTVTAVDMVPNGQGLRQMMITIKREGDDWAEGIDRSETLVKVCPFSAQEIIAKIKDAGIVGMGGATFPTHVKLSVPPGKKAECVIINGVECEPYLTSDHRTMLEHGEELMVGVTILMKAVGVEKAYIGIENNKPDAIAHLKRIAAEYKGIEVVPLKVMYPQGGEKQLINAITGRKVGPGQLPYQVGAIVCNVDTCRAIYQAVKRGLPVMTRVVTTGGDCVKNPGNYKVRIGTSLKDVIEQTGGFVQEPTKLIMGGPMMGMAIPTLDVPAVKGTSGLLAFGPDLAYGFEENACLRCGKCVYACPMKLLPNRLDEAARADDFKALEKLNIADCIECGSCAFSCPSKRRQVQQIKVAKVKLRAAQQRNK